jgi:translocation and assembly module TamA
VFVDSGEAVSDIRRSDLKPAPASACAGSRRSGHQAGYRRPVGDKEEHGLQFYIGLGPEL